MSEEWVEILYAGFWQEVGTAYGLLQSAGIPARLKPAKWRKVQNRQMGEAGDVLLVPASFAATARALLESKVSDEELIAEAEAGEKPDDA